MAVVLDSVRTMLPARQTLSLIRQNHGLLVVARPDDASRKRQHADHDLAEVARAKLERVLSETGAFTVWAGVGTARAHLSDLVLSYREALQSAQVAAALRNIGSTVHYADLGVYTRIAQLVNDRSDDMILHPGIEMLLDRERSGDPLAATLEVYLDNAGDVVRSAEQLHLHRASLYGRIHRIEELTKLDMTNGHDRLVAHLELKLARLLRLRPASTTGPAGAAASAR
jgi:DNA-binding PucR family transcriptional regulator